MFNFWNAPSPEVVKCSLYINDSKAYAKFVGCYFILNQYLRIIVEKLMEFQT